MHLAKALLSSEHPFDALVLTPSCTPVAACCTPPPPSVLALLWGCLEVQRGEDLQLSLRMLLQLLSDSSSTRGPGQAGDAQGLIAGADVHLFCLQACLGLELKLPQPRYARGVRMYAD